MPEKSQIGRDLRSDDAGTHTDEFEDCAITSLNKNPKVFFFTTFVAPYYRPVLEHLSEALTGLRVFVSTPMDGNRDWNPDWGSLVVTVQKCLSWATPWPPGRRFSDSVLRHFPYDTSSLLIRHRPAVVISLQLGFRSMQAALYRKLFPKSRLILWLGMSERTEEGLPRWRVLQRKALLQVADAVLVTGSSGMKYLLRLGVPQEKVFLHPYYPEIGRQLELSLERRNESERRLLYVGRLIDLKGLTPFLAVLSNWLQEHPDRSCEFWIVGDGPIRRELENVHYAPSLRVRFLGNIAYEDLSFVYLQSGIFVFPSLADEWGVVVNEALAAGLPVLGSIYGQAVEDLVQEGVNGWRFRPDHPQEVYAAIDRAMSTPDNQLEQMRRAGRNTARRFTPDCGAKSILAAINFARSSLSASSPPATALSR